jgi:hypothetical protein
VGAAPCRSSAFPVVVEVDAINVLYVAFASPNSKHPRLLSLGDIYGLPSVSSPLLTLFLSLFVHVPMLDLRSRAFVVVDL